MAVHVVMQVWTPGGSASAAISTQELNQFVRKMNTVIGVTAEDPQSLESHLREQGLSTSRARSKDVAAVPAILVALGGGTGLAAVIASLGVALRAYLKGRAGVEGQRRVVVTKGSVKIEITGDNIKQSLQQIRAILDNAS